MLAYTLALMKNEHRTTSHVIALCTDKDLIAPFDRICLRRLRWKRHIDYGTHFFNGVFLRIRAV
jgi:hypothetical protein